MDFISIPLVIGIITLGVYKLFELFVCKKERLSIIDKLGDKITVADLTGKFTLPSYSQTHFSSNALKAGCLMLGVGLGLLLAFFICSCCFHNYVTSGLDNWNIRHIAGIVYGACTLLFGGIGLIIAFIIELNINKKKDQK